MPLPNSANVVTTHLDAGTDDPAQARPDLKIALDELKNMIDSRDVAGGVAPLDGTAKVPLDNLPLVTGLNGVHIISTPGSGTWTYPTGVTRVKVTCVGGGGGGAHVTSATGGDHGGGGGAGGVISKIFEVDPAGDDFAYTVGALGAGGGAGADNDGADGGFTLVTSPASATPGTFEIRANGGAGGLTAPNRFGGAGGQVSHTNDSILPDAEAPSTLRCPGGAGISGATRGGAGGSNSFQGGVAGGTGYGGGGGFGSGGGTAGFNGTDGFVMFEW